MRFLIIGLGSIGRRHFQNLRKLGNKNIAVVRNKKKVDGPQAEFLKKHKPLIFYSINEAYKWRPDAVIVANPTNLHVKTSCLALENNAHVFIEKPLSHNMRGVNDLIRLARKKKKIIYVGYHLRHHPQLKKIKKMLDKGIIGKIFYARFVTGEYLPDWHPWENYRKGYAARKDLGGGVVLTQSHDLDIAYWFFGKAKVVASEVKNSEILKLTVEDFAEILARFKNCPLVSFHVDYLVRPPVKTLEIYGTKGRLAWNYHKSEFKINYIAGKEKTDKLIKFERNDMYISELKYFIKCAKYNCKPATDGMAGKEVLKMAISALKKI